MITAARHAGKGDFEIAKEIYEYDITHHTPPLFTDPADQFRAKTEYEALGAAMKMVSSVTRTLIRNKVISFESVPSTLPSEVIKGNAFKEKKYPETGGTLGKIQRLIMERSESDAPNLALGGAIAIMATLCSNKYRFDDVWTNMYILNLAPTGGGKGFPFKIAKDLLVKHLGTTFIKGAGAQSGAGLTKNLISSQNRLELIDEVGSFFTKLKSGGVFQMEMVDILCDLWSSSNDLFLSPAYSEREDTSSCFNPCVNILSATTIDGLKNSVDKMMINKGLLPRFLTFVHYGYGKDKDGVNNQELAKEIAKELRPLVDLKYNRIPSGDKLKGDYFDPANVATNDTREAMSKIRREFYSKLSDDSGTGKRREFLTRGKEQICKLTTIKSISEGRAIATVDDVAWAKKVFLTSLDNMGPLLDSVSVESSQFESDRIAVMEILRYKGSESQSQLLKSTNISADRLQKVVQFLSVSNQIEIKTEKPVTGRPKTVYYWL
jgi:hypothetical protein